MQTAFQGNGLFFLQNIDSVTRIDDSQGVEQSCALRQIIASAISQITQNWEQWMFIPKDEEAV